MGAAASIEASLSLTLSIADALNEWMARPSGLDGEKLDGLLFAVWGFIEVVLETGTYVVNQKTWDNTLK